MPDKRTEYQVNLIKLFIQGEITEAEYVQKRELYGDHNSWNEVKEIAGNPEILYPFLLNLPIYYRNKSLVAVQNLSQEAIRRMTTNGKGGGISNFFNEKIPKTRGISHVLMELAIFMDAPIEFLMYEGEKNKYLTPHDNSFQEYKIIGELINIKDLPLLTLTAPNKRMIKGYRVINDLDILPINKDEIYARLDRTPHYYCLQFYIDSTCKIDYRFIPGIVRMWDNKVSTILIGDAFLRDTNVLTFLGTYNDTLSTKKKYLSFLNDYKETHRAKEIPF